jgi:hypothetical protein
MDQFENFSRRTSLEKVLQQKLAYEILEKKVRADIVTAEQAKLREMCYIERA